MKKLVVISILFAFLFANLQVVDAKSGCCSSHGGVSGCGCADGTPLSAVCRSSYPECSGTGGILNKIIGNTKSTKTSTPIYKPKTVKKTVKKVKKTTKKVVKKVKKVVKKPTPAPKHKKKK